MSTLIIVPTKVLPLAVQDGDASGDAVKVSPIFDFLLGRSFRTVRA